MEKHLHCHLFISNSRSEAAAGLITERTIPLLPLDIEQMGQDYYGQKKALRQGFNQFKQSWQQEWRQLIYPEIGLIHWTKQELKQEFLPGFGLGLNGQLSRNIDQRCHQAWAAVWTVGPDLDEMILRVVRCSALQAMFLDVAGTLMMATIRKTLHQYLLTQSQSKGHTLIGEYIPEISEQDQRLRSITAPWMRLETGKRPDFTLNASGVLHPLKTQCSMLFIGSGSTGEDPLFTVSPCSKCKGSKCLYLQFGGCHLPPEAQPIKQKTTGRDKQAAE